MAQVTEDLVFSSVVSSTGVTDWNNTTTSDDNRGTIANTNGNNIIFELTNLSQTPTSITSIQHFAEAQCGGSQTVVIQHEFLNSSNTQLYTENEGYAGTSDNTVSGTVRTTSDGSTAWTENDINTLRIKLTQLASTGGIAVCDHFFVRVIYDVADPVAGLIKLNSGKIKLNSGLIGIKN
jgi:hypothetical protein